MKKTSIVLLPLAAAALAVNLYAGDKESAPPPECSTPSACETALESQQAKAGYSIGYGIGSGLKHDGVDIDLGALIAGVKDSFTGGEAQLSPEQQDEALAVLRREMTAKIIAERAAAGEKAKKDGVAFLAANKDKEGVKTLPSGLQYKVIKEGEGAQPKPTDKVTVNYRGTLIDGTEFDSSYERGEPVTLAVDQVIKGWSEALPLMKTGSKWQLFVPADLAYGKQGAGSAIPPNATLVFEVELLGVNS